MLSALSSVSNRLGPSNLTLPSALSPVDDVVRRLSIDPSGGPGTGSFYVRRRVRQARPPFGSLSFSSSPFFLP